MQRYQNLSLDRLLNKFFRHEHRESKALDILFAEVLDTAAFGKLIKRTIQTTTTFTYPGAFLKQRFPDMPEEDRKKLAKSVNDAAWIYDNIHIILSNLQQVRQDVHIDIRRLSLSQLYQAKSEAWCHQYAQLQASKLQKPEHLDYSEEQFNDLMDQIM